MHRFETKFRIDDEKALEIAKVLLDEFYGRKGFFKDYVMPEYILPKNLEGGTREHALYLTYVISVDYMTDAENLWRRSRGAYEFEPENFDPERITKLGDRTLQSFLKRIGARFPATGSETWRTISKVLLEKYQGDPRNITAAPLTVQQIKQRLQELPHLRGNKLSNFYIRAMGEKGLFKVKDLNELDVAVDIQVARFSISTGVLELLSDNFTGCVHELPIRPLIQEAWRTSAQKLRQPPWKLDEPIWTIGSKLCSNGRHSPCPVKELCNRTKGFEFKNAILVWRKRAQ